VTKMNRSTGLVVREATPGDAETVARLVGEIAAHQGQSDHVTVTAARWRELLALPEVTVLLAEAVSPPDGEGDGASGGEPVGYVSAVRRLHLWSGRDVLALDDLYVRPGSRDRGVGGLLMTALAERADGMTIVWGVQPDNHDAIRFYQRLGATTYDKVICTWTAAQQPR
jgi:ribosomal protein S18 acetylase RimI-like enzyme